MIGIIGAMKIEVLKLHHNMKNVTIETISGIDYYKGTLQNKDVVVAVSGIGKVNAAVCTQTMILKYQPDMIINTGVAGSLSKDVHVLDIVVATEVVQHDMDTSPLGDPKGFITGPNIINIPCSKYVADKLYKATQSLENTNAYRGIIATGDQFINKKADADRIAEDFSAIANEMEGGSIGHVCYLNHVDFGVIRAISDGVDDDSQMDYNEFAVIAADKSIEIINQFLKLV